MALATVTMAGERVKPVHNNIPEERGQAVAAQHEENKAGFWSLIGLQAQGAFSDNVFKALLMMWVLNLFANDQGRYSFYSMLIGALIPGAFLIFSCWAGMLADKYSKRTVILATKVAELVIVSLAMVALLWSDRNGALTYGAFLTLMSVAVLLFIHSAFFSPSKYSIIPELVPEGRLAWANGILGLTTYLAIILGSAVTPVMFGQFKPNRLHLIGMMLMVMSVIGFTLGWGIRRTPAANPGRTIHINFLPQLLRYMKGLMSNRTLALTVLGLTYFWGLGNLLLLHLLIWGKRSLAFNDQQMSILNLALALGIGFGSFAAGMISRKRIEVGLVPLGCIGICVFCVPLAFARPELRVPMLACLFLVGASAGMYSVPLNAILQSKTDLQDRGGMLAAVNYFTDSMMIVSATIYGIYGALAQLFGFGPNALFIMISVATLVGALFVLRLLPEELIRLVTLLLVKVIYRIRVFGRENIPASGPALLVANHTSFVDALLIQAATERKIRFVVWEGLYRQPLLRFFLKNLQCIPVSSEQSPRELLRGLKQAAGVLKDGELLCIFAEGQITRTGLLLAFNRGYSVILKEAPAPVVPVFLDGVWGSIFSFERGRFFWKWPRHIPYPVRMMIGKPLPPSVSPIELHQAIEGLSADAAIAAMPERPLLSETLISQCRRHWGRFMMTDILSPPVKMGQGLWRAVILARRFIPLWEGQQAVGVFLPPSVGGALVNYAAALAGRTVVNLNYTTGQDVLDSCAHRAGIKTVVTARAFLEKVGLQPPAEPIYIEDYRGFRGFGEVIKAILVARFAPVRWVERYCGCTQRPTPDSLATIIFSSGSTGEPKGVMLTQANIASNAESFRTGVRIEEGDKLLGILPFFHSFGYTVALWGAVYFPVGLVYHLSPIDIKTIGELCEKHGVTILVTTPTFLGQYLRRIPPAQFGSITSVVTGAEKLPGALRQGFRERFGVEPLEGYGTTECSPVVSVNVDDIRMPGIHQVGHKPGSIGHPLPGIAARIIHPETGEPLPAGQSGLLLIKGANVMKGYLGMPELTAEVIRDGWYNTGDVAYIDEDGFIFITDRLSRFSKIGGEMAPHVRIEEKLHEALGLNEPKMIVTAVPDAKKGEQLVVLHTLGDGDLDRLFASINATGLPNLWIPRRENFFKVEAIPLLGSGKLDLQAVRRIAQENMTAKATVD